MMRNIRSYFIGVNTPIKTENNIYRERVYLNSAATGLPLRNVVKKVTRLLPYYSFYKTNAYAGLKLTEEYENVRKTVLDFVKADNIENTVVYVKSSTYAINLLSELLYEKEPDSVILTTAMNGLASFLPFSARFKTELVGLTPDGNVDLLDLEEKLISYDGKVKLVAITAASNITGITPPYYEAARLAHLFGAKIFVDTTQLLQHMSFDMKPNSSINHIDFIAFSAHKYYSPYGGGALVGPTNFLEDFIPPNQGPYITSFASSKKIIFNKSPLRYETGYENILGIIGMGEAIKTLKYFGLNRIKEYEKKIFNYTFKKLKDLEKLELYGLESDDINIPIISFNVIGKNYKLIASELGLKYGIVIDSGSLSSDLYVHYLLGLTPIEAYEQYLSGNNPGVCRISLALYNNKSDIDRFIEALKHVIYNSGK